MSASGKKGNKGGGRKPLSVEMKFFALLDKTLPKAVNFCENLIDTANTKTATREDKNLGAQASKILMSRAPERIKHSGDEDSPIRLSVDL